MKQIVLIGDSIRMGYQETVQQHLMDRASVWGPLENGGPSHNVLAHLDEWIIARQPDVLHINCGLHDLKREFDTGELAVSLDEYCSNVRKIFQYVQQETDTAIAWAAITPVHEGNHQKNKPFARLESDVEIYNIAAHQIADEFDIPINDLYSVIMQAGRDELLVSDGVHFTTEGYTLLGQTVVKFLQEQRLLV